LPNPARKKGLVYLHDADSFIAFIKAEGSLASCRIYALTDYLQSRLQLTAILNDHEQETPHWRDYRAIFQPTLSEEWKLWTAHSGKDKAKNQVEMATFIEDNLKDIASAEGYPTGAQMLQMATQFEARQDIIVKSSIRLESGAVEFTYINKEDDPTIAKMQAFDRFRIGIRVFLNGEGYPLTARLRYRTLGGGKLSFWYDLVRPDVVFQDAATKVIDKIKASAGFPILYGRPE
jgi:uncharacterized protein YfdQ (DUF2303 family)